MEAQTLLRGGSGHERLEVRGATLIALGSVLGVFVC